MAVLREFNNESLCVFFQRAFRILNKNGLENDFSLAVPHVRCSHFMHIVHRKVMAISREQRNVENDKNNPDAKIHNVWYRFNMYSMSLLVNTRTLPEFIPNLEDISTCLLSEMQTDLLLIAYHKVNGRIHSMSENKEIDLSNFKTKPNDIEQENDESPRTSMQRNPFSALFSKKLSVIEQTVTKDQVRYKNLKKNRCLLS